jgi:hypothetical protein
MRQVLERRVSRAAEVFSQVAEKLEHSHHDSSFPTILALKQTRTKSNAADESCVSIGSLTYAASF